MGLALILVSVALWLPLSADAFVIVVSAESVTRGTSNGFQNQQFADGIANVKQEAGTPGFANVTLPPNGDATSVGWDVAPCQTDPIRYDELAEDPADDAATCRYEYLSAFGPSSLITDMEDITPPSGIVSDYDVTATGRVLYFGDDGGIDVFVTSPSACGGPVGTSTSNTWTTVTTFFERCNGSSEWTKSLIDGLRAASMCFQAIGMPEVCMVTQHKLVVGMSYVADFSLDLTSQFDNVLGVDLSVQWDCTTDDEEGLDLYVDGALSATGVCSGALTGSAAIADIAVPRSVDVRLVSPNQTGDATRSAYSFDMLRIEGNLNENPTADAGPDQTVRKGSLVQLDGSASADPDGQGLVFDWTQVVGPPVVLSGANTVAPTFIPPRAGTYAFVLRVDDGYGGSDEDVVAITALNQVPTADAGMDRSAPKNTVLILNATSSSDPDGDALTFSWLQTTGPPVALSNPASPLPSFLPTEIGVYGFLLIVDDGDGGEAIDVVSVTVWGRAPVAILAASGMTVRVGIPLSFDASGSSDPDGTIVEYAFDFGDTVALGGSVASAFHSFASSGTYTVTLRVTDDDDNQSVDQLVVSVSGNDAPTSLARVWPTAIGFIGTTLLFAGGNSSDDLGISTYEWTFGDGTTGVGQTVTHAFTAKGAFTVHLRVTDSEGSWSESSVSVTVANRPPVMRAQSPSSAALTLAAGRPLTFVVQATDPDGDPLSYAWSVNGEPAGLDAPFYEFPGAATGQVVVNVTVSDGTGAVSQAWSIVFAAPTSPLTAFLPDILLVAIVLALLFFLFRQRRRPRLVASPSTPKPSPPDVEGSSREDRERVKTTPSSKKDDLGLGLLDEVIAEEGGAPAETGEKP